jgi:hypothetical protein
MGLEFAFAFICLNLEPSPTKPFALPYTEAEAKENYHKAGEWIDYINSQLREIGYPEGGGWQAQQLLWAKERVQQVQAIWWAAWWVHWPQTTDLERHQWQMTFDTLVEAFLREEFNGPAHTSEHNLRYLPQFRRP